MKFELPLFATIFLFGTSFVTTLHAECDTLRAGGEPDRRLEIIWKESLKNCKDLRSCFNRVYGNKEVTITELLMPLEPISTEQADKARSERPSIANMERLIYRQKLLSSAREIKAAYLGMAREKATPDEIEENRQILDKFAGDTLVAKLFNLKPKEGGPVSRTP